MADTVPGDSSTTAELPFDTLIGGTSDFEGDGDWFKVTLSVGTTYRFLQIGAGSIEGAISFSALYLRDASGSVVASDVGSGHGNDAFLTYTPAASGTFYADAGGFGSVTGDYSLLATSKQVILASGADPVTGTNAAEAIIGDKAGNTIEGGEGNDIVFGFDGNDRLVDKLGGAGIDKFYGGNGDDTIVVPYPLTGEVYDGGEGNDTLDVSGEPFVPYAITLGGTVTEQGATFSSFENVIGTKFGDTITGSSGDNVIQGNGGDDKLYGEAGDDTLHGNEGEDLLDGGTGADTLAGGAGNDSYFVDDAGDTVTEDVGGGAGDTVYAAVSWTMEAGEEIEFLIANYGTATSGITLTGNGGNNTIAGGAQADVLAGGAGTDTLSYFGSAAGVTVDLGRNTASGGDAQGDVFSGFENLIGSEKADTLTGGLGTELIFGLGGDDTFIGDLNGTAYFGNSGTDTISFADEAVGVSISLSSSTSLSVKAVGSDDIRAYLTGFERIAGTGFGDVIFGLRRDTKEFQGGGGDDVLGVTDAGPGTGVKYDGGTGLDTVSYIDAQAGVTASLADPGANLGMAKGDTHLAVENLTGSNHRDTLTGDANANAIEGGDGDDRLDGGAGSDTLVLGGARSGYTVTRQSATTWTVTGQDGTDSVSGFETVRFGDATVSFRSFANVAPKLAKPIAAQTVNEDSSVRFQVPAGTFTDSDGDALTFSATLANGALLPAWLKFDGASRTFSGQPPKDFNGVLALKVTASDGLAAASGGFTMTVTPVNDAPLLTGAKAKLAAGTEDEAYVVSAASLLAGFTDVDGGKRSVVNLKADHGSVTANADGTFTVTPAKNYYGAVNLSYGVSDGKTTTAATQSFALGAVNDAPAITSGKGAAKASYGVKENSKGVAALEASDIDSKALSWSLSGKDATLFAITKTGHLSFKAAPDHEKPKDAGGNNTYDVVVRVSDGRLADTQALSVTVTDVKGKALEGTTKADALKGTAEADTLTGGKGADDLWGGAGKDVFVFAKLSDSTASAKGRDTVFDFAHGDRFDLSALDASSKKGGNQAFTWIGADAFGGKAGELRYDKKQSDTYVTADVNGDKRADFGFHLDDAVKLVKGDFVL